MELTTITEKTDAELRDIGKKWKLDIPAALGRDKLEKLIYNHAIKLQLAAEQKARKELLAEAKAAQDKANAELGIGTVEGKPSPETLAILASKKIYATFKNFDQPYADATFRVGGTHYFHLYDGKVHVIPDWLRGYLRKRATFPRYEMRTDPKTKLPTSVLAANEPRFMLESLGDAPDDAEFGVVLDDAVLAKIEQLV